MDEQNEEKKLETEKATKVEDDEAAAAAITVMLPGSHVGQSDTEGVIESPKEVRRHVTFNVPTPLIDDEVPTTSRALNIQKKHDIEIENIMRLVRLGGRDKVGEDGRKLSSDSFSADDSEDSDGLWKENYFGMHTTAAHDRENDIYMEELLRECEEEEQERVKIDESLFTMPKINDIADELNRSSMPSDHSFHPVHPPQFNCQNLTDSFEAINCMMQSFTETPPIAKRWPVPRSPSRKRKTGKRSPELHANMPRVHRSRFEDFLEQRGNKRKLKITGKKRLHVPIKQGNGYSKNIRASDTSSGHSSKACSLPETGRDTRPSSVDSNNPSCSEGIEIIDVTKAEYVLEISNTTSSTDCDFLSCAYEDAESTLQTTDSIHATDSETHTLFLDATEELPNEIEQIVVPCSTKIEMGRMMVTELNEEHYDGKVTIRKPILMTAMPLPTEVEHIATRTIEVQPLLMTTTTDTNDNGSEDMTNVSPMTGPMLMGPKKPPRLNAAPSTETNPSLKATALPLAEVEQIALSLPAAQHVNAIKTFMERKEILEPVLNKGTLVDDCYVRSYFKSTEVNYLPNMQGAIAQEVSTVEAAKLETETPVQPQLPQEQATIEQAMPKELRFHREISTSCNPQYHTIHIDSTASPSPSVMRRPPLHLRFWGILRDIFNALCLFLHVNRDCIFCLGFFVAFVVSASFLTAFFYRTLSLTPHIYHRPNAVNEVGDNKPNTGYRFVNPSVNDMQYQMD